MPPFPQQPTPATIANNSPSTSPPPPSPTINQQPPPPCPSLNSPQQLMKHHHYQRIPTPPRLQMPTLTTNNWTRPPPRPTTASPSINQWPPPHPPANPHRHQPSPSPTIPLQHWPLPPKLNIPTDMMKEWESAHRNFHMQAEASMGFAHSKKPPSIRQARSIHLRLRYPATPNLCHDRNSLALQIPLEHQHRQPTQCPSALLRRPGSPPLRQVHQ